MDLETPNNPAYTEKVCFTKIKSVKLIVFIMLKLGLYTKEEKIQNFPTSVTYT